MGGTIDLFDGLSSGLVPQGGGWIFVARFHKESNYAIFEIISYANVKRIEQSESGVEMFSRGLKAFVVYEPTNYPLRFMEPYLRDELEQIPLRWENLEVIEASSRDRVLVSKEPYMSLGSFVIETPRAGNFVYYVYEEEGRNSIRNLLLEIFKKDYNLEYRAIERVLDLVDSNLGRMVEKRTESD